MKTPTSDANSTETYIPFWERENFMPDEKNRRAALPIGHPLRDPKPSTQALIAESKIPEEQLLIAQFGVVARWDWGEDGRLSARFALFMELWAHTQLHKELPQKRILATLLERLFERPINLAEIQEIIDAIKKYTGTEGKEPMHVAVVQAILIFKTQGIKASDKEIIDFAGYNPECEAAKGRLKRAKTDCNWKGFFQSHAE